MLWLLVVAVAAVGALARGARRGGPARRAARTHHRVLDTLDTITRQAADHPVRARDAEDAHTHVRLVRAEAETGAPAHARAPRPGRTLGSAPFRAPVARHVIDDDAALALPDAEEQVRVRRSSDVASAPAASVDADPVDGHAGPVDPLQDRAAARESFKLAVPGDEATPAGETPVGGGAPVLRFDEDVLTDPAPTTMPPVPHLPPEAVAALASSGRRGQRADATKHRSSSRHRAGRQAPASRRSRGAGPGAGRRTAAMVVIAAAAVLVVVAVAAALTLRSAPSHRRAAAPNPPLSTPRPASAPTVAPTTVAAPATLVSSTPQDAVYSLAGPSTITFTASRGASWIELRQGAQAGTIVYQGILRQGQAQNITGPAWVRLGNPTAVSIAVNQTPLAAPTLTAGEPFNLQFR